MSTNMNDRIQSLEQFHIDAPRMSFYNNASEYVFQTTANLHQRIIEFAKQHNHKQEKLIYWCTQIPLAPLYTEKNKLLKYENQSQHLFDNGRQRVTFDEHTGNVHIIKPFRIDQEGNDGQFRTTQYLSLYVTLCSEKEEVQWIEHDTLPSITTEHIGTVGVVCALAIAYFMIR